MRLMSLKSDNEMFGLFGLNPACVLQDYWNLPQNQSHGIYQELFDFTVAKSAMLAEKYATGLVLDPTLNISPNSQAPAGLILPLQIQKSVEVDPLAVPKIDPSWGVVEVKNNYGVALLTVYYHPQEPKALLKKQLIAELSDFCKYHEIDLILDLIIFTPAGEKFDLENFQESQVMAVQELRSSPQAVILQYPLDPLACATMTTELDIPWLVSSRGLHYEEFKETLRTSLEGGASGFYAHEISWAKVNINLESDQKQIDSWIKHKDEFQLEKYQAQVKSEIQKKINTETRDQLIELMRITNEFGELER
jgi:tagatose-1,6-bisphosphate aldolase